jgi:hypothetical protein
MNDVDKMVAMLRTLRQDINDDVKRRDGQPFDGRNVSVALGEMCAQIDALAGVLIRILDDAAVRA